MSRPSATAAMVAALVAGCQENARGPSYSSGSTQPEMPGWIHLRTDKDTADFVTGHVHVVGTYRRFGFASFFREPLGVSVEGQAGQMASRSDLIEVDCATSRVRVLRSTVMDEKGWHVTHTSADPVWLFVGPDTPNVITILHACGKAELRGKRYGSLDAARASYRATLSATLARWTRWPTSSDAIGRCLTRRLGGDLPCFE